ncbi:MAG: esterase [Dehalococcoidia bacterium]|nr:esterase [Dehalococcoidia bacterium]
MAVHTDVIRLFEHDSRAPLDTTESLMGEHDGCQWYRISFNGGDGRRVPGVFVVAKDARVPQPAVMLQHGGGTSKYAVFVRACIDLMAQAGFCCIAVDAIGHGDREEPLLDALSEDGPPWSRRGTLENVAANVVDFRRTLDYLNTRADVDPTRLAYVGSSMGGMLGAVFSAVEPRIKAVVLRCSGSRLASRRWEQVTDPEAREWLRRVSELTDPAAFVGMISPRPLLMLNNLQDEVISREAAEALFHAAGDPKEQRWYPGDHRGNREVHAAESWGFLSEALTS